MNAQLRVATTTSSSAAMTHSFAKTFRGALGAGLLLWATSVFAQAPQSIESILENARPPSEAVWLEVANEKIPGIFVEEQTGTRQGAAVIVHDLAMHPDWPEIIGPLRSQLPAAGWTTISISPPALRANSLPDDPAPVLEATAAAISAALKQLAEKGYQNVAIIGLGMGAATAAAFLANTAGHGVDAFIGINMAAAPRNAPAVDVASHLEKISLPILDIYGEFAPATVVDSAAMRALAAKKSGAAARANQNLDPFKRSAVAQSPFGERSGFIAYRQIVVPGAGPAFLGTEDILVKRIVGWLRRHATGVAITR